MPFSIKIAFTIATFVGIVLLFLAATKKDNASPNSFWRGGGNDPFRNLFFKIDGSFRRFAKVSILVIFLIWLLVLWMLVPSQPGSVG